MSKLVVIGVSGWAGSGKDTVGLGLVKHANFQRLAFADRVKEALLILDPHIPSADAQHIRLSDHLFKKCKGDWNVAKQDPEVRRLLQYMGTQVGRNFFGPDVWWQRTHEEMKRSFEAGRRKFVITDVRFRNEAEWIKRLGGSVWRVNRPGNKPATNAFGQVHESETGLDNWRFDVVLTNGGTIGDLVSAALEQARIEEGFQ